MPLKKYWHNFKKKIFSWNSIKDYWSTLGVLYAASTIINYFASTDLIKKINSYTDNHFIIPLLIFVIIPILYIVFKILRETYKETPPPTKVEIPLSNNNYKCIIEIGNIFNNNSSNIIISANRKFQTNIFDEKEVNRNSTLGQFIEKNYNSSQSINNLNEEITKSLKEQKITVDQDGKYPIGSVAHIKHQNSSYYLVATCDLTDMGNSCSTEENLDIALSSLWKYIPHAGQDNDTAIHLLGIGKGRLQITQLEIITKILKTFIKESKDHKVSELLTIYIHPKDAIRNKTDLIKIKESILLFLN